MGLLQNIALRSAEPLHYIGAGGSGSPVVVASTQCVSRDNRNQAETNMNAFVGFANLDPKGGIPYGYGPPSQFVMPVKDGGMSSFSSIESSGTVITARLASGKACSTNLLGAGSVDIGSELRAEAWLRSDAPRILGVGTLASDLKGLAISYANLSGSGEISNSDMRILAWCLANLSGNGTISASDINAIASLVASVTGQGEISSASMGLLTKLYAALTGNGDIASAALAGIANMSVSVLGAGSLAASVEVLAWCISSLTGGGNASGTLRGNSFMDANISALGGTLTAGQCAAAVWNSIASSFDTPGTMGEKLNDAGGGSSPSDIAEAVWNEDGTIHNIADSTGDFLRKILGLSQRNIRQFDMVYNGDNKLTSSHIRIYPTPIDCENDTNHIEELIVTAAYDVFGNMTSYKVKVV